MSSDALLGAVVKAVAENDERALAAATKKMTAGYLWGLLGSRAHELAQGGDPDLAFGIYRTIVSHRPTPDAWNNLCWALNASKKVPALVITKPLLERALEVGPKNPPLFHNIACAAVKCGLNDLAIEAVAGASKHGYTRMDQLRADPELAPLATDPRYATALTATLVWTPAELAKLALVLPISDEGVVSDHVVQRPVMAITFYLAGRLQSIAPRVAPLFDAYLADIPAGTLTHYARVRSFKPLTKAMITKERKGLAEPRGGDYINGLFFRPGGGGGGDASEYEIHVEGADRVISVNLHFPLAEASDPDRFEERFLRYATLLEADTGNAGYSFSNRENDAYEGVSWETDALAHRFAGFERVTSFWAAGKSAPAHWLTWLGKALARKAGRDFGKATLRETDAGLLLRASRVPPVGARGLADIGALPDVARGLKSLRIESKHDERLARFDEAKSTPWENAPPGWTPSTPTPVAARDTPAKRKVKKKASFFDE